MATLVLTIAGVEKQMLSGWDIHATAQGNHALSFSVLSLDGTYRPALDAEVILTEDGTRIFGGFIMRTTEMGVGGERGMEIITEVVTQDFNVLAERRYISIVIAASTLKAALTQILPYLAGATLHGSQADGPTFPEAITYTAVKTIDILNDLTTRSDGWLWSVDYNKVLRMVEPGTVPAPFNVIVPNGIAIGDVTVEPTRKDYANRIVVINSALTVFVEANDAGEQASRGIWDAVYTAPDPTTTTDMQALADLILQKSIVVLKEVRYKTLALGLKPTQTQTINLPHRNVNNTYLIVEVNTRSEDNVVMREVVALEGLVYRTGWQETWRQLLGGGHTGALAVGGGGGGSSLGQRFAYFLGGNGTDAVRNADGTTWVPASVGGASGSGATQVQLNTVARGTTQATVFVRLRTLDAGVSVKARLFDVTASTPCSPESAVVSTTTWQTVSFTVTLTAGSHFYELQLLPNTANMDVLGVGYLE